MSDVSVLINEEQIQQKIRELAQRIISENGEVINFVTVLDEAKTFSDHLIRAIQEIKQCTINNNTLKLASAIGSNMYGKLDVIEDIKVVFDRNDVIVIENLVDRGISMDFLVKYLKSQKNAGDVKIAALLDKPTRRIPGLKIPVVYTGFQIDDVFVVGFGLDHKGQYADLPHIGVLNDPTFF